MKKIVSVLCILVGFSAFSQKNYSFPQTFPDFYKFDPDVAFKKLNVKPLTGLNEEQSTTFRIHTIYEAQRGIDRNDIYLDWIAIENYLYKIFDTLIPLSYQQKHPFKIFVERSPELNAHALDNGFLNINIGLLASVRSEAALASTLAHEAGHAIFDHGYNKYADYILYLNNHPQSMGNTSVKNYLSRNYELTADTFAFSRMLNCGYNLKAVSGEFDIFERDLQRSVHASLSTYTAGDAKRVRNYFKEYSSHPMNADRVLISKVYARMAKGSDYLIDSVMFQRVRKLAQEEVKKILFESGQYKRCTEITFLDYLQNEKNLKNLFYLIESIRRLLYIHPEYKSQPFLTESYADKEFVEKHYSILQKPDLIFLDSIQQAELSQHMLFKNPTKEFHTYEQALNYFCNKGISMGFNESYFTLALYKFASKEENACFENLTLYLANNGGVYTDFAKKLLENKKVASPGKKMLLLFDNSGMYSEDNAWSNYNYYQAKSKLTYNPELKKIFVSDTSSTKLVLINELLGKYPAELNQYQKIEQNIISLFTDREKEIYRKKRVSGKELPEDALLSHKFTKNILIFVPEYYKYFNENDIGSVCFANISYDYEGSLNLTETRNDYTTYFLNFSSMRPYVKTGIRGAGVKKQSTIEMAEEIADFLYGK